MNKRDYYEILGIDKGATAQQIKSAYRKLAKEYHPDRNKDAGAEGKFKEMQEAYEILSDDRKRSAYDKYGHAGTQGFGGGGQDFSGAGGFGGFDFNNMGGMGGDAGAFNDIFEQFFGNGFGGFSSSGSSRPRRGADLEVTMKIQFTEAIFGIEKIIRYKRHSHCEACKSTGAKAGTSMETCKTCQGQGRVTQVQRTFLGNFQTVVNCPDCQGSGKMIKEKCPVCSGKGIIQTEEDFKIKIPHGIPDGVTLRFRERGNTGHKGGEYGDLFVNIEVKNDPNLERKGDDIYTTIEVDAVGASHGCCKSKNCSRRTRPRGPPRHPTRISTKNV